LSATVGIFLLPWLLAAAAAQQLQRFLQHPWLAGFGRGAAPAVIGLFGVMALNLAKQSVTHWAYALLALVAFGLALWTKVHPVFLLIGGTVLGWVIGAFMAPTMP
jgi:chromate transporter